MFSMKLFLQRSVARFTDEEAYQSCLGVFETKPAYQMRNSLPSIPVNVSIDACVNDLMVSY